MSAAALQGGPDASDKIDSAKQENEQRDGSSPSKEARKMFLSKKAKAAEDIMAVPKEATAAAAVPAKPETETETKSKMETKTETRVETETENIMVTEAKSRVETATENMLETETENEVETETENKTETETANKVETETENKMETDTEAKVETETAHQAEMEIENKIETEAEVKTEAEKIMDTETESMMETETEPKVDTETESMMETETEAKVDTEMENKVETETENIMETEMEITASETNALPKTSSAQSSKKRPREEERRKYTTGPGAAAAAAGGSEECEEAGEGAAAGSGVRIRVSERGQRSAGAAEAGMGGSNAPKPLEDPKVHEVVSQDLASQEIRRVKRKGNSRPAPPTLPATAPAERPPAQDRGGPSEAHEGGKGEEGSGASPAAAVVALTNGVALAERQRPEAIWPADGYHGSNTTRGEESSRGTIGKEGAASGSGGESEPSKAGAETKGRREHALASKAGAGAGTDDAGSGSGAGKSSGTGMATVRADGIIKQHNVLAVEPSVSSLSTSLVASATKLSSPSAAAQLAPTPTTPSAPGEDASPACTKAGSSPSPSSPIGEGDNEPPPRGNARRDASLAAEGGEATKRQATGRARNVRQAGGEGTKPQAMEEDGGKKKKTVDGNGEEGKEGGAATALAAAETTTRSTCRCPDHALPVARTFFDYEAISGLEMRMLPEFFTGRSASKTPEIYMQSRNYMVRSYQRMLEADADGQAYLTGTECRRKLASDACSILRIHDFLDRFGLINTRAAGKRPPSCPAPPPSMHLWNPTPAAAAAGTSPSFSRAPSGEQGAKAATQRERGRGGAGAGAGSSAAGGAGGEGAAGAGSSKAGGQLVQKGLDGDEREWHREELVLLMKAAMANPHQWDAVAHQVGGGRTPAACMKRFLNLAVEEVVRGDSEKKPPVPAPSVPAAFPGGPTFAEASSTTASASSGCTSASDNNGNGAGVDPGGLRNRHRQQLPRRPPHLGQAVPALVLASTLASNVHPKVLMAAMSAATKAADRLARCPAVATPATAAVTANGRSGSKGSPRVCSSSSGGGGGGTGGVAAAAAVALKGGSCGGDDPDQDVEMRDVEDGGAAPSAAATAGSGQGVPSLAVKETCPSTVANGGQRERGAATPPQEEGPNVSPAVPRAAWDSGSSSTVGSASVGGLELAGAARATMLSVAGLHARGLAEQEDRRTEALLADLLEARVQRLEARLHCFDELDQVLETERQALEHDRAELLVERAKSCWLSE